MSNAATSHVRVNRSLLAVVERRVLVWVAERLPARIHSDHLTALSVVGTAVASLSFALARLFPVALLGVAVGLAINWFGDSLDGTVARVRDQQRPRYGYYVDHVLDLAGTAFLFAGLAASGYMSSIMATLVVASFFLVSAEAYLATHARGVFKMAFLGIGPTELRILIAAGALALLATPVIRPMGMAEIRLFDLGGIVAVIGMVTTFIVTTGHNIRALYIEETNRSWRDGNS